MIPEFRASGLSFPEPLKTCCEAVLLWEYSLGDILEGDGGFLCILSASLPCHFQALHGFPVVEAGHTLRCA